VNPPNATCLCYDNLTRSSYCSPVTVCGNTTCSSNQVCIPNRQNNSLLCIDLNSYVGCNNGFCGSGSCIADEITNPPNVTCLCNDNSTKSYCPFIYFCGNTTCSPNQVCLYNRFYNNQHCVEYDLFWSGCNNGYCGNGNCIADDTKNSLNVTCLCNDNSMRPYCPNVNSCGNTTCSPNQVCLYNRFYHNQHCVDYNFYNAGCNNGYCGNGSCIADETTNPPNATCLCNDNSTRQSYCPEPNPSPSNKNHPSNKNPSPSNKNPSPSNKNPSPSNKNPSPSPSKSRGQENRG